MHTSFHESCAGCPTIENIDAFLRAPTKDNITVHQQLIGKWIYQFHNHSNITIFFKNDAST
jgi:hypothetical protein